MSQFSRQCLSCLMDPRTFITLFMFFFMYLIKIWTATESIDDVDPVSPRFEYHIDRTWNDKPLGHNPVTIKLLPYNDAGVKVLVEAPYFNDPAAPGGDSGQPFPGLWDYEVVEVFFLNEADQYLEVELSPHGQHLVLLLNGYRKSFKDALPLEFQATIEGKIWKGEAVIPAVYFPHKVTRINAYAIHGSDDNRLYEALYPTPNGKFPEPDFHRLQYFQAVDFTRLLPSNGGSRYSSSIWQSIPSS